MSPLRKVSFDRKNPISLEAVTNIIAASRRCYSPQCQYLISTGSVRTRANPNRRTTSARSLTLARSSMYHNALKRPYIPSFWIHAVTPCLCEPHDNRLTRQTYSHCPKLRPSAPVSKANHSPEPILPHRDTLNTGQCYTSQISSAPC